MVANKNEHGAASGGFANGFWEMGIVGRMGRNEVKAAGGHSSDCRKD